MGNELLKIKNLKITIKESNAEEHLVDGVDLSVKKNSICALVGNSGCGKSLIASSIVGVLAENLYTEGDVIYRGENLLTLTEKQLNSIRGKQIGIVMQNCAGSLNPLIKNGKQLSLVIRAHGYHGESPKKIALRVLEQVKLECPERILREYPHQLSGGMKQRLLTAIGMCSSPKLLIMDEPTKGMDVILRNQVVGMIGRLHRETGVTILLITHDLNMAHKLSDYCYVMNKGRIVTHGETNVLFASNKDPNLVGLLAAEHQLTRFFTEAEKEEACLK